MKKMLKKKTKDTVYRPFCRGPWNVYAILLVFGLLVTMVWGFHLLNHVVEDLSEQAARVGLMPSAISVAAFQMDANGAVSKNTLVRASLVNIAGISKRAGNGQTAFVSVGSGVIITPNGHVVTAAHVIGDLKEILVRVQTPSGPRQYPAKLVKISRTHDLAVIKLVTKDLFPFAALEQKPPIVGAPVTGWGDPSGTTAMIRSGSITRTDATVGISGGRLTHMLRTNAVSDWSQSGGPLVNADGRVVGINIAIQDDVGTNMGYAVPINVLVAHFQDVVTFPAVKPVQALPAVGAMAQPAAMVTPNIAFPPAAGMTGRAARQADAWWQKARALFGAPDSPANAAAGGANGMGVFAAAAQPRTGPFGVRDGAVVDPAAHAKTWRFLGYDAQTLISLLILGLVSGISGGMMTMGGGIIKVSGLILIFGYGMVLIRPVAYLTNIVLYGAAVLRYRRYELIRWAATRQLIPWAMAGVVLGYFLGNIMGSHYLHYLLGVFAALVGVKMVAELIEQRRHFQPAEELMMAREQSRSSNFLVRYLGRDSLVDGKPVESGLVSSGILGLPMGIVSGILGITGGVVEVPLQRYIARMPLRNAIANSAVLVLFASSVGAVVSMLHGINTGAFDWDTPLRLAAILVPGAYAGGLIGAWLTKVIPIGALRWLYAVLMFLIAGRMFLT